MARSTTHGTAAGAAARGSKLRVGLDLDNTLMRNDIVWRRRLSEEACRDERPHRPIAADEVSIDYDHFRKACETCFERLLIDHETLLEHELIDGAREAIAEIHARGAEFHVITARPIACREATERWLDENGLREFIASVQFAEEKAPVCRRLDLDIHIDDSTAVHDEVTRHGATRIILFDGSHNQGHPCLTRCASWHEVRDALLEELEERRNES